MSSIHVTALSIFPLKSAAGIALDAAQVEPRGFRHDRRFMVVNAEGHFLTQRELPRLALIGVSVSDESLQLKAPDMPLLVICMPDNTDHHSGGKSLRVLIWGDHCDALALSPAADAWLSRFLGTPCRLVYMPDQSRRPIKPAYSTPGDHVSFADGFPFLILSEESLADLNSRLPSPLPMNRFRPNIVVAGGGAFVEDGWREIQIGEVAFRVVKPCARCTIPGVDQDTAVVTPKEPLLTLAGYRKQGHGVMFGQNAIADGLGTLRVGDRVLIKS